jgi:hypothetical protein
MLRVDCLSVDTLGQAEDHLIVAAVSATGKVVDLDSDVAERLLTIGAVLEAPRGQLQQVTREHLFTICWRMG